MAVIGVDSMTNTQCPHPNVRNGFCVFCLQRVALTVDAMLTGRWRAAVRRLKASQLTFDRREVIEAVQKDIEENKYVEK
jgi:histone acetyltransferase (RNA polymerase elongator complex component)